MRYYHIRKMVKSARAPWVHVGFCNAVNTKHDACTCTYKVRYVCEVKLLYCLQGLKRRIPETGMLMAT